MGKDSARGSLQLFIGRTISTVVMALGAIVLGWLILPTDYGLYTVAFIPAATISLFQDWGVGTALVKYSAQLRAKNKDSGELRQLIVSGLTFEIGTGVLLTIFSLVAATSIAILLQKPEAASLIALFSFTILFGSVLNAGQAIFVGFEQMRLITYVVICQAIVQCVLPAALVYEGYGAYGAVIGYVFSTLVACVVPIALLYFVIFRKLNLNNTKQYNIRKNLSPLLRYGVPLAIATIIGGLLTQFSSLIMAYSVDTTMIGNYKIALNFALLLTFFTTPIATVLFPAFSKIDPHKEQPILKTVFAASVKYAAFFLVPATMAMMVLSKSIISTVYGDKWLYAPPLLALYIISNLFVIFGSLTINSFLSATGETKLLMALNLLALAIGLPMSYFLIPIFGITGMIIISLIAGLPGYSFALYWIWKHYKVTVEFKSSAKIFLSSSLAAIATLLFLNFFAASAWIMLLIGTALFLAVYLILIPVTGAINQTDINNLKTMFVSLGPLSKLLEVPITIIERLLRKKNVP